MVMMAFAYSKFMVSLQRAFLMLSNDENEAKQFYQLELSKGFFSRPVLSHLGSLEITPYVPKPVSGISHNSHLLFSAPN